MAKTYILIDSMNLFYRATHTVSPAAGIDAMIGMSFHIILNGLKKTWRDFKGDHAVFCLEGSSFRKSIYPEYKLNRKIARLAKTEAERENEAILMEAFNDLCEYVDKRTNMSVLQCPVAEADDLIALFIQMHPDDNHVILSTDQDYYQLLADNVKIYNGVDKVLITKDGFFDEKGKPVIDRKTKKPKEPVDVGYFLFKKCIRGDKSDNIFSAYPGAPEKGTKNRIGIREAYEDRDGKGYKWNNFMLQRWTDPEGTEHRVKDKYDLNRSLIDLTAQPDDIRVKCIETIMAAQDKPPAQNVGISFMRFCGKWDLKRISDYATDYTGVLNAKYPKS